MSITIRTLEQKRSITGARQQGEQELAPLRTEVARLIVEVGWGQAKSIIQNVHPLIQLRRQTACGESGWVNGSVL